MTLSAWAMLCATWAVIFFFTGRFFWMVLSIPPREEPEEGDLTDKGQ